MRPQHLLLRVAMRALVMWSGITPAEDWVMQQLPRILQVWLGRLRMPASSHALDFDGGECDMSYAFLATNPRASQPSV